MKKEYIKILLGSFLRELQKEKREILLRLKKYKYYCMNQLAQDLEVSLPNLAYHIIGNKQNLGLIDRGLIVDEKEGQRRILKLTEFGVLIVEILENGEKEN